MTLLQRAARRLTYVLFLTQSLVFGAFIAMATVNPIVVADLSGNPSLAGVPSAVTQVSAALSALVWGMLMAAVGRRRGIALGLSVGVLGALLAAMAVHQGSLSLFLGGLLLVGVGMASMSLARFVAGDVHPPEARGRAIALVVLGGTVGSIGGPALISPAGRLALRLGVEELVGPYAAGFLLMAAGALLVALALHPDPDRLAASVARQARPDEPAGDAPFRLLEVLRRPPVVVAMGSMVVAALVMRAIMVITSLHMRDLGHSLGSVALVMSAHTLGMFAFSVVSGRLADRLGRLPVIALGALVLIVACLGAGVSVGVPAFAVYLFLLGLGWNFCYVGGSALLSDHLALHEQTRAQGANDLFISLVSAAGTTASGFLFGARGYALITHVGWVLSLVPLALALRLAFSRRRAPVGASMD